MKKKIAILGAISVAMLAACGSKTDVNEKNFRAAIEQGFDKKGELCIKTESWPVDLDETDLRWQTLETKQMAALEAAGLAKSEKTEVEHEGLPDRESLLNGMLNGTASKPRIIKSKIVRYTLTDAAKPFAREKPAPGSTTKKHIDLCWGKMALDKIVKWEGPLKLGDYQEVTVSHTYKITNLADWAKQPEVQSAFPEVKRMLDGAGSKEIEHGLVLTSRGWESAMLH
jgi:hypothetical protein